ncbi:MAG: DNA/RNA non-specific endonuclease [Lachnospiraceae bacterium]
MVNNKSQARLAFILSIVGFATGFLLIGIIFDIIAIVFAYKAIKKNDKVKKFAYYALGISAAGIVFTSIFYNSIDETTEDNVELSIETETETETEIETETEVIESTEKFTVDSEIELETESEVIQAIETESESEILQATETETESETVESTTIEFNENEYSIIVVDGGDRSGNREASVAVDIGYGDRVYWGLTNEYGQLVYVIADEISLQDDSTEPVNSDGRYYDDEATVAGSEESDLDQGHVIADSLGGVSNAYNITPQNSTLNRYGDQAYMEEVIRDAGGCQNFVATISYLDTTTQIPSHYHYTYTLMGNEIVEDFDNINPENEIISEASQDEITSEVTQEVVEDNTSGEDEIDESSMLADVDANGNGQVTITEAKAAGFSMPIYSSHWLYKYMDDRDGDGMVGE